jgi:3,4-dihydroxy 2-butanone 4-phosphate synthase/GTP cyclohydrolase II
LLDGTEHVALVAGRVEHAEGVLTCIHSESILGDLFGAAKCDSGSQLDAALAAIAARGSGVLVYLRGQQARGLGLFEELLAQAQAQAEANNPALEDAAFPVRT